MKPRITCQLPNFCQETQTLHSIHGARQQPINWNTHEKSLFHFLDVPKLVRVAWGAACALCAFRLGGGGTSGLVVPRFRKRAVTTGIHQVVISWLCRIEVRLYNIRGASKMRNCDHGTSLSRLTKLICQKALLRFLSEPWVREKVDCHAREHFRILDSLFVRILRLGSLGS